MMDIDERVAKVKKDEYVIKLFREVPKDILDCVLREYVQQGGIVIDCKRENPQRVKNLFVRSLTRLYTRISMTDYHGSNSKRDDYIRDSVEKVCCKPVVDGTKVYCRVWDSFSGAMMVHDEYGYKDDVGCPDYYAYDRLTTFDHAFSIFFAKSGNIDFVAYVHVDNPYGVGEELVFYTENRDIRKIVIS